MSGLLLIAFGLGLGAGWKLWRPKPLAASANAPKPEVRQSDGSLILARKEDPTAKPAMQIPTGDVVQRVGHATIQPSVVVTAPISGFAPPGEETLPTIPPATVIDWAIVKEPDGGSRVILNSPTGTVTGGEDIVVTPAVSVKQIKWAVLATRYFRERTYGVTGLRTYGPAVVGLTVKQSRAEFGSGKTSLDAAMSVGLQF